MKRPGRYAATRFRVADLTTMGYLLAIAGMLLLIHDPVPDWRQRVLLHAALVVGILELARAAERRGPGLHPLWIARTLYPIGVMAYAWGQLNALVPLLYGSYWGTAPVLALDLAVFGTFPTVWIQTVYRPWLDELMAILYVSYYAFLTVPAVLLFQRQAVAAAAAASIIAVNYFTNFAFYILVPTKGPRHVGAEVGDLVPSEFGGYVVARVLGGIQEAEAVVGAAFPSSHVSGATVCTLIALRYAPRLGKTLAPLTVGMSVATVYLGYHHAMDPIGGILWGAASFLGADRWLRARGERPEPLPIPA